MLCSCDDNAQADAHAHTELRCFSQSLSRRGKKRPLRLYQGFIAPLDAERGLKETSESVSTGCAVEEGTVRYSAVRGIEGK